MQQHAAVPQPTALQPADAPATPPGFGVARAPLTFAFGSIPSIAETSPIPFGTSMPPMSARRIDVTDQARAIGTQIAAAQKGFLPYDQIANNPKQLAADYERLRLSHELSREIALERDLPSLLDKILLTIFKFIRADRGVIFLMAPTGELVPAATRRRDGTDQPISVSSTILNHVIEERATVLTHDAAMDFAASKGKSMILNRISSRHRGAAAAQRRDPRRALARQRVAGAVSTEGHGNRDGHRGTGRDVHRDQHPGQEGRAGDRQPRAVQPPACRPTSPSACFRESSRSRRAASSCPNARSSTPTSAASRA